MSDATVQLATCLVITGLEVNASFHAVILYVGGATALLMIGLRKIYNA